MPLFDPHAPLITLRLTRAGGTEGPICIDAIPARITPLPGYTLDDAILVALASCRTGTQWNTRVAQSWEWAEWTRAPTGFAHPVAHYGHGAVQAWPAAADPCALPVVLDHPTLTVGSTATTSLDWPVYGPHSLTRALDTLDRERHTSREGYALALGAVAGILASRHHLDLVAPTMSILGRAARPLFGPYHRATTPTQKATIDAADAAQRIVSALAIGWIVRPNSLAHPSHAVAGPAWAELEEDARNDPAFDGGFAAAQALTTGPWTAAQFVGLSKRPLSSAHAAMALARTQAEVDGALRAHLDPYSGGHAV